MQTQCRPERRGASRLSRAKIPAAAPPRPGVLVPEHACRAAAGAKPRHGPAVWLQLLCWAGYTGKEGNEIGLT